MDCDIILHPILPTACDSAVLPLSLSLDILCRFKTSCLTGTRAQSFQMHKRKIINLFLHKIICARVRTHVCEQTCKVLSALFIDCRCKSANYLPTHHPSQTIPDALTIFTLLSVCFLRQRTWAKVHTHFE